VLDAHLPHPEQKRNKTTVTNDFSIKHSHAAGCPEQSKNKTTAYTNFPSNAATP
jgi:hypothetical protein